MADTDTETLPNGTGALSEEDERMKQRPADIDADVREMERRKRVEALMSSKMFREELERVLDQQLHEGGDAPLLQRIREMVGNRMHPGRGGGPSCVLPINDIRGIEGMGYEKGEKILRCKLAAVYRLVDLFGWTQTAGMAGQITARLNTAVEQVLTTPRGLLPHEVTASSLVKVDMQGAVVDQGTTNFPVNAEGFSVHGAVHAARPDLRCVLHVRSASVLAVSCTKRGLLPLCHEAALLGDIAYHQVPTGMLDNEEQEKLVRALGPHSKVLVLASAGALCCGSTLEEAFYAARNLTAAADVQLRLNSSPLDDLYLLSDAIRKQIYEASRKPPSDQAKWRVGGEEFEALMRMLDNAGFRTGYIYRHPLIKNDVPKPKNDVEVPPAVSSLGYLLEEEELYRQGLWKKGFSGMSERERFRWLNSPNVYQKVEVLETGTTDPRKITKWVQDGSPGHSSTPVKIDTLQFVPKNTNPKEFKNLQQQIKDNRRADKISAGPQSHILEGVTWDEAAKLAEDAQATHTGDHVVLMGAASKGIIQRGYQHNATVYAAPYARNPFDHVTDTEIAEYKRVVERKQKGDYDTDLSESEALSGAQLTSPASAREDDEARDGMGRVLRIETAQAPVRSQPEVVLSDDFLHAERAHADRTKGTLHAASEALSANKRSVHEYSRNANFKSTVQKFESIDPAQVHPKCKVSLNTKLPFDKNDNFDPKSTNATFDVNSKLSYLDMTYKLGKKSNPGNALELFQAGRASSQSSLCSIPSIEWDGRCRSEYALRTRSLPRKLKNTASRLYRTQSHCGFVNFNKDPEPTHYHLPKCNSCGATNNSYAWEISKDERQKKSSYSLYESVGNLHQKCLDELSERPDVVKVTENYVPVFKVTKKDSDSEFVESQEFTEDNYLGDLGNSFTSDDKTVIDKMHETVQEVTLTEMTNKDDTTGENVAENDVLESSIAENNTESAPAVYESEDINNNTMDSVEGEYHSFTEEMDFEEAVYESPVKDLVEKDIRDYSVPMDVYFKDYKQLSPEKAHQKRQETNKGILEPILEESKSSYDDSGNASNEKIDLKPDGQDEEEKIIDVQVKHYNSDVSSESSKTCINNDKDIKIQEVNNDLEIAAASRDTLTQNDEVIENKTSTLSIDLQEDSENERKSSAEKELYQNITELIKEGNDHETETIYESGKNDKLEADSCIKQPFEHTIVNEVLHRVGDAVELKKALSNCQPNVTNYILELESIHQRESYDIIADEDSEYTTNDIEMVSNVVQTAMDVYPNLDDDPDIESAIVDNIYKNVCDFLSTDAISRESKQKLSAEYSVTSCVEIKSFDSTAEFEKYEAVADVIANILNKIDTENEIADVFVNLPKEKIGSHFDAEIYKSDAQSEENYVAETKVGVVETDNEFKTILTVAGIDKKEVELTSHLDNVAINKIVIENVLQSEQVYEYTAIQDSSHEANDSELRVQLEDFSIVKMIQDLELNVNLNETVLTEASDTDLSHTHKIVEGVLYYVLNQVFFTVNDKAKANKERKMKKVITVVDFEDILLTTSPVLLGVVNTESIDRIDQYLKTPTEGGHNGPLVEEQSKNQDKEINQFDINMSKACELENINAIETISEVTSLSKVDQGKIATKESIPDIIPDEPSINFNLEKEDYNSEDSNSELQELFFGYLELAPANDLDYQFRPSTSPQVETRNNELIDTNETDSQYTEHLKQKQEVAENAASAANDFDKQTGVEEIEFCLNDALKKQRNILLETPKSDELKDSTMELQVDENFREAFHSIKGSMYEHAVVANDQSIIQNEDLSVNETEDFVSITVSENISTVQSENFVDSLENSKPFEDRRLMNTVDTGDNHDVTFLQHTTFMDYSEHDDVDDFNTASQSVQDSTEIVSELVNSIIQQSFDTSRSCTDTEQVSSDTCVLNETEDFNNAFVETKDYYSRSSSPNKKPSFFEVCTESPIRNPNNSFVGEDLSVLYENNDTILGSPFVKQAPVIAMSQSVNSGGIKYWLSFDESVSEIRDKPMFRSVRKSKENNFPSFVTVDFKEEKKKQQFWNEYEKDTYKRSSILDMNQSKTDNIILDDIHQSEPCISNLDSKKTKRRSILLAELDQSSDSNLKIEDSFVSCLSPDYHTCESGQSSKFASSEPKKVLLYDSRVDLHTMTTKRQYASWPPFEDTLFYRIISKFRMSESFDPNDFEDLHIDVSL